MSMTISQSGENEVCVWTAAYIWAQMTVLVTNEIPLRIEQN